MGIIVLSKREEIEMNWHEFFIYDNGTLFWKVKPSRSVLVGSVAGGLHSAGYVDLRLNKKAYLCHRIIWEMHNGIIPEGMEIDHINHIRDDNRIENLRLVSRLENHRNRSKPKNNKSGFTGVRQTNSGKWTSYICLRDENNKRYIKTLYYGDSFDCAVSARVEAVKGFGFHDNHGE
ncbi:putative HNH endonuclease [Escherichia phage vB_EcoS_MM01]|uniref:Putative HNH endonuclease n=1 Tax=Escherichia phage vB_EcoS_MM01 TaxID=2508188 RepID=A0A482N700_9CAUD|nr:putative HNH endonuclease [Escherichia phage vB_EcoS_MM01]